MKRVAVLYATREGHTRRIAERIASGLSDRGLDVVLRDLGERDLKIQLERFDAAVLAASVHLGKHEKEMERFVIAHRIELERMPSVFVSVSLSQAGVESIEAPAEKRAQAAADVQRMIDTFVARTGWRPAHVEPVAGALLFSRYNFLMRFIMKRISKKAGGPTDTSQDHVLTDWPALERVLDSFAHDLVASAVAEAASGVRQN